MLKESQAKTSFKTKYYNFFLIPNIQTIEIGDFEATHA